MTQYAGNKSLDAEISIDLEKGKIQMDYSLTHLQDPDDSNRSAKLTSKWWGVRESKKVFLKRFLVAMGMELFIPFLAIYCAFFSRLSRKGYLKDPKYQYNHQDFLRKFFTKKEGVWELSHSGPLFEPKVVFWIPGNIWVEYQLEGEYQEKIQTISLVRNFVKFKKFGLYDEVCQNGWLVIFKFSGLPQNGSCLIKYV